MMVQLMLEVEVGCGLKLVDVHVDVEVVIDSTVRVIVETVAAAGGAAMPLMVMRCTRCSR